jgi:hypothetical protein
MTEDINFSQISTTTDKSLEEQLSSPNNEYPKLFTDIYPTEIRTRYGRSETLTCLVIILNKTITEGLENYEPTWYKTNLENELDVKDLVFVIKNIGENDLDNYYCKIKDKRTNETSNNIGNSTIRLKTEEELKEDESDDFDFATFPPTTNIPSTDNYPKLFTDIYPTEIGTRFGRSETLTCLVIILNKTITEGLENYEPTWYKTNLENELDVKDLVFVIKNIGENDLDNYYCKIKDKRTNETSNNIGNSTIRLKTEEELKDEEDDEFDIETLVNYETTVVIEEISSSTKHNYVETTIDQDSTTPFLVTTKEQTILDAEDTTTKILETTPNAETTTTIVEKEITTTLEETTFNDLTTPAKETQTAEVTTPKEETTTTQTDLTTSIIPTTSVQSRPDFVIYASFSSQNIVYLANGESLSLTCSSYSTYEVPLNTMIYKDRVIY